MTSIESHGNIESKARETYGTGTTILRIGNGGAGATGLIGALASDYLSMLHREASITWICNHSRNTQLALRHRFIDIALTYERDQEKVSIEEGWAYSAGCLFHDHFCLAGPMNDPASVAQSRDVFDAFRRIADTESLFINREDYSATMIKERAIWQSTDLEPWSMRSQWYVHTHYSPAEAVRAASSSGAYILTDRSTLLHQTGKGLLQPMTVFFEPKSTDSILMNSCHALYSPQARPEELEEVYSFLEYVWSERGQRQIRQYGHKEAGIPLFAEVASGYARTSLVGGGPVANRWVPATSQVQALTRVQSACGIGGLHPVGT